MWRKVSHRVGSSHFCDDFAPMHGHGAILLYSNKIIADMPGDRVIDPREGTYLIGVFNLVASAVSLYTVKRFQRRTLFCLGHYLMGVLQILIGLFIYYD